MGLVADLQADLVAAFADELADAVTSFVFSRKSREGLYNPATLTHTPAIVEYPATTVAGTAYTNGTCRGVLGDKASDDKDNIRFNYKVKSMLVLNSELDSHAFNLDDYEYFVTVGTDAFTVMDVIYDPAYATAELLIGEVQDG